MYASSSSHQQPLLITTCISINQSTRYCTTPVISPTFFLTLSIAKILPNYYANVFCMPNNLVLHHRLIKTFRVEQFNLDFYLLPFFFEIVNCHIPTEYIQKLCFILLNNQNWIYPFESIIYYVTNL